MSSRCWVNLELKLQNKKSEHLVWVVNLWAAESAFGVREVAILFRHSRVSCLGLLLKVCIRRIENI